MNAAPTWTNQSLRDVHERPDKGARVRAMFAQIARRYDLNNHLHSLGRDRAWRCLAADMAQVTPADRVLDVATGTGDLAAQFVRRGAAAVTGIDFCPEMLDRARDKYRRLDVRWLEGDALALPFADGTFTLAAIAFGLRNVQRPQRCLEEMFRVVSPGGRAVVLEFHPLGAGLLGRALGWYVDRVMPITAGWIARDRSGAYRYLSASVGQFATAGELDDQMRQAGFAQVTCRKLAVGLAAIHVGVRP